jgi:peptidoglycan/xylan/chitin deacetylase (PgdA/CDA1 family)
MRLTQLGSTARAVAGMAIAVTLIGVTQVAAAPHEHLLASSPSFSGQLSVTQAAPEPQGASLPTPLLGVRAAVALQSMPKLWGDPVVQTLDLELYDFLDPKDFAAEQSQIAAPTDCTLVKCVAITIDDGPGPFTETLLSQLAAAGARATFFVVGAEVARNPELAAAIVAAGHELGLHSHTHPRMPTLGDKAIMREFYRSRQAIQEAVGQDLTIYRPPFGMHSSRVGRLAEAAIIMWDVDPQDWRRANQRKISSHITARVQPGSIVLLHELAATTRALPEILEKLRADGYQLVTVSELLGTNLVFGQIYKSGPAPQLDQ